MSSRFWYSGALPSFPSPSRSNDFEEVSRISCAGFLYDVHTRAGAIEQKVIGLPSTVEVEGHDAVGTSPQVISADPMSRRPFVTPQHRRVERSLGILLEDENGAGAWAVD